MGFDIEAPELGLQRSLGEKDFLTSGPLTGSEVSLSDAIPSELSTESSRAILSDASSISSQAPEAQFALRRQGLMDLGMGSVSPVSPYFNLPMRRYAGGGLFNPMKTGRRIF
jgi:hypothetical protein